MAEPKSELRPGEAISEKAGDGRLTNAWSLSHDENMTAKSPAVPVQSTPVEEFAAGSSDDKEEEAETKTSTGGAPAAKEPEAVSTGAPADEDEDEDEDDFVLPPYVPPPLEKHNSLSAMLERASVAASTIAHDAEKNREEMEERLNKVQERGTSLLGRASTSTAQAARTTRLLSGMGRAANVHDERAKKEEDRLNAEKRKAKWKVGIKMTMAAQQFAAAAEETKQRRSWLASSMSTRRKWVRGDKIDTAGLLEKQQPGAVKEQVEILKRKISTCVGDGEVDQAANLLHQLEALQKSADTEFSLGNEDNKYKPKEGRVYLRGSVSSKVAPAQ